MKITGDNKTNVLLTYDNLVSLSINDDSKSTVELDGIYDIIPAPGPDGDCSGLTVSVFDDKQLNLSWTNGFTNHAAVSIERKLTTGGTFAEIFVTSADATTYNNTGLTEITGYTYRVRAILGGNYSNYSNEATATTWATATTTLISRYETSPTSALATLINTVMVGLITDGVLAKSDCLYIRGLHTSQAACQNWIKNAHNSTLPNAPTFIEKVGFQCDGISTYINNNYRPRTHADKLAIDSITVSLWMVVAPVTNSRFTAGATDGTNRIRWYFLTAANDRSYLNSATQNANINWTDNHNYGYTRNGTSVQGYTDGAAVGAAVTAAATAYLVDLNMYEGCENSSGSASSHTAITVSHSIIAGYLTATEMERLHYWVNYFYTNVGGTF